MNDRSRLTRLLLATLPVLALVLTITVGLLGATSRPLQAAAPSDPPIPVYTMRASVDFDAALVAARQQTVFPNRTGQTLDRVVFQVASAVAGVFQLDAVQAQGQPVQPMLDGSVLEVPLPEPLPPGTSAVVELRYQLQVPRAPGRLSASQRVIALGNWFPTLAVHRGDWDRHQYTDVGDSFVTEPADFDVQLTTSVPLVVAATGRVRADSGTSFRIQARAVRDLALSLSPDYVVTEARTQDALIRAYTFDAERGRRYADAAAKYLDWYGQRFGRYPYQSYSVAEVDLPASYGGMEYPTLVFLAAGLGAPAAFDGSSTDLLIGHETAHQWFYSLVGNDQVHDPWLDEAFAEYLPYYVYRDVSPEVFTRQFQNGVLADLDAKLAAAGGKPVDASIDDFPSDGPYFVTVYRQGARFLDELRQAMGDAAFAAAVKDHVTTFADKLATPRAVLDLYQQHTDVNLNPLIRRYFSYGAFQDPAPASWNLALPDYPWRSSATITIDAAFPVAQVEVWLDDAQLYQGASTSPTLDLSAFDPGDYLLLVRLWDDRGAQLERARRVVIAR